MTIIYKEKVTYIKRHLLLINIYKISIERNLETHYLYNCLIALLKDLKL